MFVFLCVFDTKTSYIALLSKSFYIHTQTYRWQVATVQGTGLAARGNWSSVAVGHFDMSSGGARDRTANCN